MDENDFEFSRRDPLHTRYTIYMLGDRQVGKTSIVMRDFPNLIILSGTDEATEYHAYFPWRREPVKVIEVRNPSFLIENQFEVDHERDIAAFCYAIDDPDSFLHVDDTWIPLFKEHVSNTMDMELIGNKIDLRDDPDVISNLAVRGLQPVSAQEGNELYYRHNVLLTFNETENSPNSSFDSES